MLQLVDIDDLKASVHLNGEFRRSSGSVLNLTSTQDT